MKEDKELEEARKRLKQLIEVRKSRCRFIDFDTCICGTKDLETVLQALETKDKTIADDAEDEITRFKKVILKDYIPKKKIKDIIKELKKKIPEDINCANDYDLDNEINYKIEVLDEILEDK